METIGATEARTRFAELLRRVATEKVPIAIERRGKARVALVPMEYLQAIDAGGEPALPDTDVLYNQTERLAGLGHWEWDEVEDKCTYCSQELARMHGLSVEAFLRQSSLAADIASVHPEDRQRYGEVVNGLAEKRQGYEVEFRIQRQDGSYIDVREKAEPAFDEGGSLVRSFGFLQDITARKKSEEALKQSEALLKQAMLIARMGAWVWDDTSDECVHCAEELALIFGQSVEDYLATRGDGEGVTRFIHPDDRAHYTKTTEESIAAGRRYTVDFRESSADGTYLHLREVGEPIFSADGLKKYSIGIVQDLTELKDAEQALRLSQAALSRAQRQARIGNWCWDIPGNRLISCSEEYARILGVAIEEVPKLLGAQRKRVIHSEDRERVEKEFQRFDAGALDYEIEYRIVRPDGEIRHVLEIGETVCGHDGRAMEQTGTVQDITERKRSEEDLTRYRDELERRVEERTSELHESNALKATILDTAPDCVISIDRAGRIIEWNTAAEGTFGYPRHAVVGRTLVSLIIPAALRDAHTAGFERYLQTSETKMIGQRVETIGRRANGEEFPLEVAITAQVSDKSHIITAYLRDLTEEKKAEERLKQAQKMEAVGQLTGGVAHDFNNLLAVIQGNAELLDDKAGEDKVLTQAILRASARGAELTHRLLAFSRLQPLAARSTDLATLVAGLTDLLKRTLGATIEIETTAADDLAPVMADPGQLENALLNLAINARDAMQSGGKLTIGCHNVRLDEAFAARIPDVAAGDYVVLSVSDSGTGMSAEVQAQAFQPFFTTKEVGQGSGLGLSMIYGFVKQSGGHVTIYSEIGHGTTVKLYLLCAEGSFDPEGAIPVPGVPQGKGEAVLVIEDDDDVRALAEAMLKKLGYRAVSAADAASAKLLLDRGEKFDLVLSDVVLPGGVSGPEFAADLRRRIPGLAMIFMSGYPAEAAKRNGILGPDNVLLNKPFQMEDLARALRGALDGNFQE